MNVLSREQFSAILKEQRVKSRLSRELRFFPEEIENWANLDMLAIGTRSGNEGLLLIQMESFYIISYELTTKIMTNTGRSKPITCDLCYTWHIGGKSGRITFRRTNDNHTFTFLCCGDLRCSLHVRDMTQESVLSRAQLHEDISTEQRVARQKKKLINLIDILNIQPIMVSGR